MAAFNIIIPGLAAAYNGDGYEVGLQIDSNLRTHC